MLVQDPTKEPKHDDVDEIFNQARQLGAVEGPLEHPSSSRSFTGTGRLLSGESVPTALQQPEPVIHNIIFWSNGFTVDDGPLRKLDDPENASFLDVSVNFILVNAYELAYEYCVELSCIFVYCRAFESLNVRKSLSLLIKELLYMLIL